MTNNSTNNQGRGLTVASVLAMFSSAPPAPLWRWCVAKPELVERLRTETPSTGKANVYGLQETLCGIQLFPKAQLADSWFFSDEDTLRKYLKNELTELDLFDRIASGKCKPNESQHHEN